MNSGATIKSVLGLDNAPFKAGAKSSEDTITHLAEHAKSQLRELAAVAGVSFGAAESVSYVKELAEELHNVALSAKRLDMSNDAFQVISFGAKKAGADVEGVERSIQLLKRKMFEASEGGPNNDSALLFGRMGLDVKELQALSPDQLLAKVARGFDLITNSNEKTNLMMEIFGRSGNKLVPLLTTLDEVKKEMEGDGLIISEKAIKAAEGYHEAMVKLDAALKAVAADSGIIEDLEKIAKLMSEIYNKTPSKADYKDAGLDKKINLDAVAEAKLREEDNKKLVGRQYSKNDNGFWANVAGSPDDIQLPVPQSDKDKWKDANHPGWRTSEADKAAQTAALEEDNQRKKHLADLIRLENDYNEAIQRRNEALNAKKNDKIDETIKQVQAKASLSEAKVAIGDDPEAALRAEKAEVIRRLEKENDEILKDEKRTALDIAYARIAAANAAEKEKKFRDAISEKGSGVKFEAMDMLGQGEDAARQKMIQELRKSKGSALTAEEEQNAGKVGSAQYQLGQIGKDRPQLQTEYLTNDLARIGGFTNSVVKADMDGINKQILEESRKTNEIFADMRNIVDKYLSPK